MDKSDVKKPDGEPAPPSYHSVMGRAMVSAGFFGWLGYLLGGWLGERGSAPTKGMARYVMKWGMGIFSAILAACSSLKASEYSEPALQKAKTKTPDKGAQKDSEPEEPIEREYPSKIPLSSIQGASVEQEKLAVESAADRQTPVVSQ